MEYPVFIEDRAYNLRFIPPYDWAREEPEPVGERVCVYCLTIIETGEPIVEARQTGGAYHKDCYYAGDVES